MRFCVLCCITALVTACNAESPDGTGGANASGVLTLPSGEIEALTVLDLAEGQGEIVEPGDTAIVQYTGWLYDSGAADRRGRQFDTSRGDMPYSFEVGAGRVIDGWDAGIPGMRAGGRRYLFIPPEMGYGDRGAPRSGIPPDAALFFDVELLEIELPE